MKDHVLYVRVDEDLHRRVFQHAQRIRAKNRKAPFSSAAAVRDLLEIGLKQVDKEEAFDGNA